MYTVPGSAEEILSLPDPVVVPNCKLKAPLHHLIIIIIIIIITIIIIIIVDCNHYHHHARKLML